MKNLKSNREQRFGLLPTALLMLAMTAGFASVGQADDIAPLEATAGTPAKAMDEAGFEAAMRAEARDAAWLTRINVVLDLDARLERQHRPFRLASLDPGQRG